jgi:outer membrane protein OmpA-like peptidoglycan-associated protein
MTIEIGGHTDNTGDAAANVALSQQRADAVRTYLIQQGVPEAMLVAKGYGDARPIAGNDTEEGRFHNRRIEFTAR